MFVLLTAEYLLVMTSELFVRFHFSVNGEVNGKFGNFLHH